MSEPVEKPDESPDGEITDRTIAQLKYLYTDNFNEILSYGFRLSGAYIDLADNVEVKGRIAALGIIAAAVTGATALVFDVNRDIVLGAGIAGSSIFALTNYARPQEAAADLLTASDAVLCIVAAGQKTNAISEWTQAQNAQRRNIVRGAYSRVRIRLRKDLLRETPNYGEVFRQAVSSALQTGERGFILTNAKEAILQLESDVEECKLEQVMPN